MATTESKKTKQTANSAKPLHEGVDSLSTTGKIFFAAMAAYLAGKYASGAFLKVRGTPEELRAIAEALAASKAFQDEINNPTTTIDSVINKLNAKNMTTERFLKLTNKIWPL
jgi:hypothetical protein